MDGSLCSPDIRTTRSSCSCWIWRRRPCGPSRPTAPSTSSRAGRPTARASRSSRRPTTGGGTSTVAIAGGTPAEGTVTRLTEDNDSRLPRYYYSVWDHYLSPTWSPDGRELIIVSNRGHIHGTGGFWRMTATPGAPIRELRYEETTWKARPDWAPDGKRVVYSSYVGRQWNQLWLMTSDGGDPVQLTYGDFDATAPRWSHDGGRIAYISNEGGNTALWTIELPGGKRQRLEARARTYRGLVARVVVSAVDSATGAQIPARLSVRGTGNDKRYFTPD